MFMLHSRAFRITLLLLGSVFLVTIAIFHLQSHVFAHDVHSLLARMEKIRLEETRNDEVLVLLPELKPGIFWSFTFNGKSDDSCHGDACYVFRVQNWPDEMFYKLREELNYRHDWILKTAYFLGHRFRSFGGYVEIRAGRVSRYEYALSVDDAERPSDGVVGVHVLGASRASFPVGFGFTTSYDEIHGFMMRAPSNMDSKILYIAFTPNAPPERVKNAFLVRLDCLWGAGCTSTKELMPALWEQTADSN
jgi:hypothetical protein